MDPGVCTKRLVENNVCSELTVDPTGGHGIYNEDEAGRIFRLSRASCFFKSVFCKECGTLSLQSQVEPNCSEGFAEAVLSSSNRNELMIFPSPFENSLTVEGKIGSAEYRLYNTNGQLIYAGKEIQKQNFQTLPSGIYLLNVRTLNHLESFKLIKK